MRNDGTEKKGAKNSDNKKQCKPAQSWLSKLNKNESQKMLFSDEDVGQEDQIGCRYNHNTKIVHDKVTETCAITVKEMRFY